MMKALDRRPTSLGEMKEVSARMRSVESFERGRDFRPRSGDVFVATYPKSGTTWVQQILHGLRTGGAMEFDEITEVVPWVELSLDLGVDIAAEQAAEPRLFKTHYAWPQIPKGGRYIYIIRNPKDVAVSLYHFYEGWFFEPGTITLDDFIRGFFVHGGRSGRWWDHVNDWWSRRSDPNCFFICYEDMKQDLRGVVRRFAAFLDLGTETVDIATRQASVEFMREHARQFDDHFLRNARDPVCGLPLDGDSSKVRSGRDVDHRQMLSPALVRLFDNIWDQEIEAKLGFSNYHDLRAAVAHAPTDMTS